MVVVAVPDVLKSAVEFLKAAPEVAALVSSASGWTNGGSGPRISGALGKDWKVPTQAIVVRRAGGPGQLGQGRHASRLDVWCYGANGLEAVTLWRTVHPALCPQPGDGVRGWTAAGCRVTDVVQEADPIPADDVDLGWAALVTPYLVFWREQPA